MYSLRLRHRLSGAFTLVEIMVTMSLVGILGLIVFGAVSEGTFAFARNISINKSYTDARMSVDRLAQTIQSAGHPPALVDATGAPVVGTGPAAGVRYYCGSSAPLYQVSGGASLSLTSKTVTVDIAAGQSAPQTGDLFLAGGIGFQAVGTVSSSGTSATITFPLAISTYCQTPPSSTSVTACKSLVAFTRVAFIAVGTTLRYYPVARSVAVDGQAAFDSLNNYQSIANLPATPGNPAQLTPFSTSAASGMGSLLIVNICAEAPDYNNRVNTVSGQSVYAGSYNKIGTSSTYCQLTTSLAPRVPTIIRSPYPN